MAGDNRLLTAIGLLERAKDQLKIESRAQLSKTQLTVINQSLMQSLDRIIKAELKDTYILSYLVDVTECIKSLTEDDEFTDTDLQQKNVSGENVCKALDRLYLKAGEYYTENDFEYNVRLEPVLIRVVDRCVTEGMTFGVEV